MKTSHRSTAVRSAYALALAVATAWGLPAIASAGDDGLVLSGPWMKLIVPNRPAGGYFKLSNHGDRAVRLVAASSPGCGSLMLHRSIESGGEMKMVMVKDVLLAPGGSVTFEPGGYHLMCMQPNDRVRPGRSVPVTLKFADGASITGDFPVKNARGM